MNCSLVSRTVVLLMIAGTMTACERKGETNSTTSSGTTSAGSTSTGNTSTGSNATRSTNNSDSNRGTNNPSSTTKPTPPMTPPASPGTPGTTDKTPMDQSESPAQIAITAEIRKAIIADKNMSMNAQNCKIITEKSGVVTLRGMVNSQAEKDAVEAKAKAVSGVTRIDNQLEIKAN